MSESNCYKDTKGSLATGCIGDMAFIWFDSLSTYSKQGEFICSVRYYARDYSFQSKYERVVIKRLYALLSEPIIGSEVLTKLNFKEITNE